MNLDSHRLRPGSTARASRDGTRPTAATSLARRLAAAGRSQWSLPRPPDAPPAPPLPPGPRLPAPLQSLWWLQRPLPWLRRCAASFDEPFTMRLSGMPPLVVVSRPQAIREVFSADPDDLHAGESNAVLAPLLGDWSLLMLDGKRHLRERKLLLPPLHGERMKAYFEIMVQRTKAAMAQTPRGTSISLHTYTQDIALEVILRAVFGYRDAQLTQLKRMLRELLEVTANPLLLLPFVQRWLSLVPAATRLEKRLGAVDGALHAEIAQRREHGCAGREDVLSMLIEARDEQGEPMTPQQLHDEMITLLVAGHETTATALCWTLYEILSRPAVERAVRAELQRVVGDGPLQAEHVGQLSYLDATIKESLRLDPVIPFVGRRLQRDMVIDTVALPAGCVVAPCIYLAHRRPDSWDQPERFRPERFLDQRPDPYAYLPFGGGVRRCIGRAFALYEMRVVIAQLLLDHQLALAPDYKLRLVRRSITFAPSEGLRVVVR